MWWCLHTIRMENRTRDVVVSRMDVVVSTYYQNGEQDWRCGGVYILSEWRTGIGMWWCLHTIRMENRNRDVVVSTYYQNGEQG